jgi:hypothetical protein
MLSTEDLQHMCMFWLMGVSNHPLVLLMSDWWRPCRWRKDIDHQGTRGENAREGRDNLPATVDHNHMTSGESPLTNG